MPPIVILGNGRQKEKKVKAEDGKQIVIGPDGVSVVDAPTDNPTEPETTKKDK